MPANPHNSVAENSDIDSVFRLPQRKLVVSENDIDLTKKSNNRIFILLVQESAGSAGGRAGGSGNRRISKVYGFSCIDDRCTRVFETEDESEIELFEIPYSAVAMDIVLSDGKPFVVQGLVDPGLVRSYDESLKGITR
jgi:hypothetical protein